MPTGKSNFKDPGLKVASGDYGTSPPSPSRAKSMERTRITITPKQSTPHGSITNSVQ